MGTYLALPNILWKKLSVYAGLVFFAYSLLFDSARDRSAIVRRGAPSHISPVASCNKAPTSSKSGFPWFGVIAASCRVRLASCYS